jgi:hypothetical protein
MQCPRKGCGALLILDQEADQYVCTSCTRRFDPVKLAMGEYGKQPDPPPRPTEEVQSGSLDFGLDEDEDDHEEDDDDEDEDEDLEEETPVPAGPATRRTVMETRKGATCTTSKCTDPAAEDSVKCVKHRDEQRLRNAITQKRLPKGSTLADLAKLPSAKWARAGKAAEPEKKETPAKTKTEKRSRGGAPHKTKSKQLRRRRRATEPRPTAAAGNGVATASAAEERIDGEVVDWNTWKKDLKARLLDAKEKLQAKLLKVNTMLEASEGL